jgi:pyruvate kinase
VADGFAQPGDRIVVVAGVPFGQSGSTNYLRVAEMGSGLMPSSVE